MNYRHQCSSRDSHRRATFVIRVCQHHPITNAIVKDVVVLVPGILIPTCRDVCVTQASSRLARSPRSAYPRLRCAGSHKAGKIDPITQFPARCERPAHQRRFRSARERMPRALPRQRFIDAGNHPQEEAEGEGELRQVRSYGSKQLDARNGACGQQLLGVLGDFSCRGDSSTLMILLLGDADRRPKPGFRARYGREAVSLRSCATRPPFTPSPSPLQSRRTRPHADAAIRTTYGVSARWTTRPSRVGHPAPMAPAPLPTSRRRPTPRRCPIRW